MKYKLVFWSSFFIITLIPMFLWSHTGYHVGGDDTRLYLVFPEIWMRRVALHPRFTFTGFTYPSFNNTAFLPWVGISSIIKLIFSRNNDPTHWFFYGLILSLSFYGIFLLIMKIMAFTDDIKNNKSYSINFVTAWLGSLLYVLNPFFGTYFMFNHFKGVFTWVTFPFLIFFWLEFVLSLERFSIMKFALIYFVLMLLSVGLSSIPFVFILPLLYFVLSLILLLLNTVTVKKLIINSFIFLLVVCVSQAFWILPMVQGFVNNIHPEKSIAEFRSEDFSQAILVNFSKRRSILPETILLYPPSSFFSSIIRNPSTHFFFTEYRFSYFLLLVTSLIIFAGIIFVIRNKKYAISFFLLMILYLILSTLLVGGSFSFNLAQLIAVVGTKIPFIGAIRSFTYKLLPASFITISILMSFSLRIIMKHIHKYHVHTYTFFLLLVILVLSGLDTILGSFKNVPTNKDGTLFRTVRLSGYNPVLQWFKNNDVRGKIITFPLTVGSWSAFYDRESGIYVGGSLLTLLYDLKVFGGQAGLKEESRSIIQDMNLFIKTQDPNVLKRIIYKLNIEYIVLDTRLWQIIRDNKKLGFEFLKNDLFVTESFLVRNKIATRVYEDNGYVILKTQDVQLHPLFLSDTPVNNYENKCNDKIKFVSKMISPEVYILSLDVTSFLKMLSIRCNVLLLNEPYSRDLYLHLYKDNRVITTLSPKRAIPYGNYWELPQNLLVNNGDGEVLLKVQSNLQGSLEKGLIVTLSGVVLGLLMITIYIKSFKS